MYDRVHGTFSNSSVTIHQYRYPYESYKAEVRCHEKSIHEYSAEIMKTMKAALEEARPNVKLYSNQPYINSTVRSKLVDYLLKMLVRLKILPFVFYKAVRYFDRYCLKRIVLLDQVQLIITTCLWIAAKVTGGNNHFINLSSDRRSEEVHTILDLGYGGGARFRGPTERYRMPKLSELIKLCGSRCNYDAEMFKQMEIHIMNALEWKLNDPSVDEYMVYSQELKITKDEDVESKLGEYFKIKQFAAYAACYLYDLVGYNLLELSKVIVDLVNDTFSLNEADFNYQTLNHSIIVDESVVDAKHYREIHKHLVRSIVKAPSYLLQCFESRGPQLFYSLITTSFRQAATLALEVPLSNVSISLTLSPSSVFSDAATSYTYASPTSSVNSGGDYNYKAASEIRFGDGYSIISRKPGVSGRSPVIDPAHSNSHQYPSLCPPGPYSRSNGSQVSIRSSASSKEHDIFDYDPSRCNSTPMSGHEEVKSICDPKLKRHAV